MLKLFQIHTVARGVGLDAGAAPNSLAMWAYLLTYIYIYIYIYIHTCVHCMCIYNYIYISLSLYIYIYINM